MKTSTCCALFAVTAIVGLAGTLIMSRPQPQMTLLVCPAPQGGCYLPPPSIGRLIP